jgi:FdhE protein
MVATATVKVMSAEEIAAQAGSETPYFHPPQAATVFAERQMRLRQLAQGHAMQDFLLFTSDLARAQQAQLSAFPSVPVPDHAAMDVAARMGMPPLPAVDWPRDAAWRAALRALVADLKATAPHPVQPTLDALAAASDEHLETQADCLLTGVMKGLDLASAPLVAAALQVYWTHLVSEVQRQHKGGGQVFGRLDDATLCPCCGSKPTSSITRTAGNAPGQRYLHCSLCGMQWHLQRTRCAHCLSDKSLAYQSLEVAEAGAAVAGDAEAASARAAQAPVQAETCDECGHYLKIMHADRDPFVDPVADDLASLTLDLLVSDEGKQRHGVNLMLLFGEPAEEPPHIDTPPPGEA